MIASPDQPRLVASFLNPALIAAILSMSAESYEAARGEPMPWLYAFIVSPLVLHGPSRRALPRDTRTHLSTWILRNRPTLAGFADRAGELVPHVRRGIRYGLRSGQMTLAAHAGLHAQRVIPLRGNTQLDELLRGGGLVGRWLTKIDGPATAYALLGVTP